MKKEDKIRKSNIDLLRFVCMLMVVSLHYFGWGGVTNSANTSKINYLLSCGLSVFCRVAVNCFYMISGYFIIDAQGDITAKRILKPVVKQYKEVWIFSCILFIISMLLIPETLSVKRAVYAITPIMSNTWWFATVFLLLTCIRPFISRTLVTLKDKELILLLICVGFFDTIQAVIGSNAFGEKGAGILHAVFMLIVGYAIKKLNAFNISRFKGLLLYVFGCVAAGGLSLIEKRVFAAEDAKAVFYNSPLMVIASVGFFIIFEKLDCSWQWPKKIAPYVFSIYLINDYPYTRDFFWNRVLHCSEFYESNFMLFHWLGCVIFFAALGLAVDFLIKSAGNAVFLRQERVKK